MSLESFVQQALSHRLIKGRLFVAFSGGLDSTVLLHLIARVNQALVSPHHITALHINHQLSQYADNWQQHCKNITQGLGVELVTERVEVQVEGKGIEAAAREARYRVFERYVKEDDILLVAHHSNDQAETFMLRLMRGAGALGLAAMSEERGLGNKPDSGILWRPLLNFSREELETYAAAHDLLWVEDDSNTSLYFDRNFLRHQSIPALLSRWPQALKQFSTASANLREAHYLLHDLATIDLQKVDERKERYGYSIDYKACAALSNARMKNLMRYWSEQQGFAKPSHEQLLQIEAQFFSMNAQLSSALVSWAHCECRQFNGRFYLMSPLTPFNPTEHHVFIDQEREFVAASTGSVSVNLAAAGTLFVAANVPLEHLSVRWRRGGERCRPRTRMHSQTVKKLLQEHQLETWLRDRVPLIYYKDDVIAVGDLWVCEHQEIAINTDTFTWSLSPTSKP